MPPSSAQSSSNMLMLDRETGLPPLKLPLLRQTSLPPFEPICRLQSPVFGETGDWNGKCSNHAPRQQPVMSYTDQPFWSALERAQKGERIIDTASTPEAEEPDAYPRAPLSVLPPPNIAKTGYGFVYEQQRQLLRTQQLNVYDNEPPPGYKRLKRLKSGRSGRAGSFTDDYAIWDDTENDVSDELSMKPRQKKSTTTVIPVKKPQQAVFLHIGDGFSGDEIQSRSITRNRGKGDTSIPRSASSGSKSAGVKRKKKSEASKGLRITGTLDVVSLGQEQRETVEGGAAGAGSQCPTSAVKEKIRNVRHMIPLRPLSRLPRTLSRLNMDSLSAVTVGTFHLSDTLLESDIGFDDLVFEAASEPADCDNEHECGLPFLRGRQ